MFPSHPKELSMFKRIALICVAFFALSATSALADSPASVSVKGPFAGTVHAVASINYLDGSQQSWDWDRGKVTALSSTSITLTRADKVQVTFAITSTTVVRNDGATYAASGATALRPAAIPRRSTVRRRTRSTARSTRSTSMARRRASTTTAA
jgi:hypothetical protein